MEHTHTHTPSPESALPPAFPPSNSVLKSFSLMTKIHEKCINDSTGGDIWWIGIRRDNYSISIENGDMPNKAMSTELYSSEWKTMGSLIILSAGYDGKI